MKLRGRLLKGSGERVNTYACENETDAHDVRRPVVTQCMNSTSARRQLNTRTKISSGTNGKLVYYLSHLSKIPSNFRHRPFVI